MYHTSPASVGGFDWACQVDLIYQAHVDRIRRFKQHFGASEPRFRDGTCCRAQTPMRDDLSCVTANFSLSRCHDRCHHLYTAATIRVPAGEQVAGSPRGQARRGDGVPRSLNRKKNGFEASDTTVDRERQEMRTTIWELNNYWISKPLRQFPYPMFLHQPLQITGGYGGKIDRSHDRRPRELRPLTPVRG
jgi:hypothetical protein